MSRVSAFSFLKPTLLRRASRAITQSDFRTSRPYGEFDFVGNATAQLPPPSTGGGVLSDPGELLVNQLVDPGTTFNSTVAADTIKSLGAT